MAIEARTLEYVRGLGYPVPAVVEISDDGTDLVMERVDGPSMLGEISRHPWTVRKQGKVLADLHQRLHEMEAPEWLRPAPCGEGDRLVHLDLHPLNVIISARGPVVIDWPNARRGDPNTDVALTWLLLSAGEVPGGGLRGTLLSKGRDLLVNAFIAPFDSAQLSAQLADLVAWKVRDPHMSETEQRAMWALLGKQPAG